MNKWNQKCRRKPKNNREIPGRDPEKICGEFYHLRADRMGTRDPAHIRGESCGRGLENDGKNIPYMFPIYGLGVLLGPIGRGVDAWIGDFGKSLCGTGSFAMGSLIWC